MKPFFAKLMTENARGKQITIATRLRVFYVFCCVKQEIKTMKTFIQDLIGVIAIFGTLYAGLIIGHGIGL